MERLTGIGVSPGVAVGPALVAIQRTQVLRFPVGPDGVARELSALERARQRSHSQLEQIRRGIDRSCVAIESLAGQWAHAFERSSKATQDQLARTLHSLKDALDLLHVSMEQGNALYRSIVKKMLPMYPAPEDREIAA